MKKKALITGASRGIGAKCAETLSRRGFEVFINYNRSERAALDLAQKLGCRAIKADVSNFSEVKDMMDEIGGLDVAVLNAGVSSVKLLTDMTTEECEEIFAVNVMGIINCCRLALPHMVRKKSGKIITLSSVCGMAGFSCETVYSASKAAVIGFTKALAKEVGPSGISVNCVAPGFIATDMNSHLSSEDIDALKDETPLGRTGTVDDVANLIAFFASDESSFITGQVISPNGGLVI
jgi:3-oxoacyl-[acyl-carrier protein] reductase